MDGGEDAPLAIVHIAFVALLTAGIGHVLSQMGDLPAAIGVGVLVMVAGSSLGGLVGFLFSLPRVLSHDDVLPVTGQAVGGTTVATPGAKGTRRNRLLGSNTNLERISEWLTTMLVGVGLTQISSLFDYADKFSDFIRNNATVFAGAPGQPPSAGVLPVVAPLLLAFGFIAGFLFFYLYTRLALSPLFLKVEDILTRDIADEAVEAKAEQDVRSIAASIAETRQDPAMRQVAASPTISVGESLYVIQNLLYEEDGYERAIVLGNQLAGTPATELARYWLLMAAAFGQRHHALLDQSADVSNDRAAARRSALNAVVEALKRDPRLKLQLAGMLEPEAVDNDLRDFREDKDFKALLS